MYFCAIDDLEEVAAILSREDKILLPSLRELDLMPDRNVWNGGEHYEMSLLPAEAIRKACRVRNVYLDEDFAFPIIDESSSDYSSDEA